MNANEPTSKILTLFYGETEPLDRSEVPEPLDHVLDHHGRVPGLTMAAQGSPGGGLFGQDILVLGLAVSHGWGLPVGISQFPADALKRYYIVVQIVLTFAQG